ncbi:unnamed protein product [Chrysodeixis includens]|uniref:Uncharacterized protein n=1 Tax=Chrysodeixis includens TaxID=689277 RepID=A0A9N8Q1A2_CHRIL|nr:unnamed protein product [Chrysodeixis includens]
MPETWYCPRGALALTRITPAVVFAGCTAAEHGDLFRNFHLEKSISYRCREWLALRVRVEASRSRPDAARELYTSARAWCRCKLSGRSARPALADAHPGEQTTSTGASGKHYKCVAGLCSVSCVLLYNSRGECKRRVLRQTALEHRYKRHAVVTHNSGTPRGATLSPSILPVTCGHSSVVTFGGLLPRRPGTPKHSLSPGNRSDLSTVSGDRGVRASLTRRRAPAPAQPPRTREGVCHTFLNKTRHRQYTCKNGLSQVPAHCPSEGGGARAAAPARTPDHEINYHGSERYETVYLLSLSRVEYTLRFTHNSVRSPLRPRQLQAQLAARPAPAHLAHTKRAPTANAAESAGYMSYTGERCEWCEWLPVHRQVTAHLNEGCEPGSRAAAADEEINLGALTGGKFDGPQYLCRCE